MKRYILLFSCILLFTSDLYSQNSGNMSFQSILRNSSDELVINAPVSLRFRIVETNSVTIVFEETHTTTTDVIGAIALNIGSGTISIGNLNTIDWINGSFTLEVGVDPSGGTSYTLLQTTTLNSVPQTLSSQFTGEALSINYDNLSNKPTTISTEQGDKIDFLTVSNPIDIDATKTDVDVNTAKIGFPGFGTVAGTAVEVLWTKTGNNLSYSGGNVGIGTSSDLQNSDAPLLVNGGLLFEASLSPSNEIGILKYRSGIPNFTGFDDYLFGDNLNNPTIMGSNPDTDIVILNDANIIAHLGVGSGINESFDLSNNTLALVSPTPSIRFFDTSVSASFPSADFRIGINDTNDGGDNFFEVRYLNSDKSLFRISANAPENAFNMLSNGSIGLSVANPSEKLETTGTLVANGFKGSISGLTNLNGAGGANTMNTGSTTIIADNNSDGTGSLIFETGPLNQMQILPNGNIGIGTTTPNYDLEVNGNLKAVNLETQDLFINNGALTITPVSETPLNFTGLDSTDKTIIIANPTSDVLVNGIFGDIDQKITVINAGTAMITFFGVLSSGDTSIALGPNESATFIRTNIAPITTVTAVLSVVK